MKKLSYLIVLTLILGLVLTGCLLSNVGQVPATDQSGITNLTKGLSPGLVGLWSFDEGEGSTAHDSSGNNNDGTIYGADYMPDQWGGQALSFVGLNDYVEVGDASELRFGDGDSITIEAWVQPAAATALGVIIQKGGITDHNTSYVLRQAGKKVDFFYRGVDNAWHGVRTNINVLIPLAWNHVAVTYTFGTPASIIIYVNGIPCAVSWQWPGSADPMENDQTLRFGGLNYWGQKYYGLIDEVRIYDYALSSGTIADHAVGIYGFNGLLAPYAPPPDQKIFKLGRTIPLKWQYTDFDGNVVDSFDANPEVNYQFVGGESGNGELVITDDPGSSGFHYDTTLGIWKWQFNWQTKGLDPGNYKIWITSVKTGQVNGPFLIELQ